jgi:hypothetical protein
MAGDDGKDPSFASSFSWLLKKLLASYGIPDAAKMAAEDAVAAALAGKKVTLTKSTVGFKDDDVDDLEKWEMMHRDLMKTKPSDRAKALGVEAKNFWGGLSLVLKCIVWALLWLVVFLMMPTLIGLAAKLLQNEEERSRVLLLLSIALVAWLLWVFYM